MAAWTQAGCTVAGLGVGAIVDASRDPTYERHEPSQARWIEPGTNVTLRPTCGEPLEGRLLGVAPRHPRDAEAFIFVQTEKRVELRSESDLRSVDTKERKYGWLIGGGIGLALDIIAVTAFAAASASVGDLSQSPAAQENGGGW